MRKTFNLPFGKLRIKSKEMLRTIELQGRIPKVKIGEHYFIWWSAANEARFPPRKTPTGSRAAEDDAG